MPIDQPPKTNSSEIQAINFSDNSDTRESWQKDLDENNPFAVSISDTTNIPDNQPLNSIVDKQWQDANTEELLKPTSTADSTNSWSDIASNAWVPNKLEKLGSVSSKQKAAEPENLSFTDPIDNWRPLSPMQKLEEEFKKPSDFITQVREGLEQKASSADSEEVPQKSVLGVGIRTLPEPDHSDPPKANTI